MKAAVVYFSRTGSTKKVAIAVAQAVGCNPYSTDEYPSDQPFDLLFIGGAIYGGQIDPGLMSFIEALSPEKVGRAAVFATYAYPGAPEAEGKAEAMIKSALKQQDIPAVSESFGCRGCFLFLGKKRPDETSLRQAGVWAAKITAGNHK